MAWIAPVLSAAGEGVASAAGTVGSALGSAATGIGSTLEGAAGALPAGLSSIGQGLESLFAGSPEAAPGFVGPPAALAGPAVTGPGFLQGFAQGYLGTLKDVGAPSAGTQVGGGLGQLLSTLETLKGGTPPARAPGLQPIVHPYAGAGGPAVRLLPLVPPPTPPQGPIMKMIGGLFQGF